MKTSNRKLEHIKICLEEKVESEYTGFEDVTLIHNALPEINYHDVNTEVKFFKKKLSAPFLIASMTGGHRKVLEINKNLATAVEELKLGMGVGSQRAAIENKSLAESFTVVRDAAPTAFIYANVGISQILEHGVEFAEKAIEMVDADALALHLNFLQEVIQPEGDVDARGCIEAIKEVCTSLKIPVIVKETGAGICKEVAVRIREAGAAALDVGGKGGTSWSGVESYRAKDEITRKIGIDFWNWGIPTAFSIAEVYNILPTIATGGIRCGLDVAKALALGSKLASAALPFLKPATISSDEVKKMLKYFIKGLKTAMFLTGCKNIDELKKIPMVIHGKFRDWLEMRGFDVKKFCRSR